MKNYNTNFTQNLYICIMRVVEQESSSISLIVTKISKISNSNTK